MDLLPLTLVRASQCWFLGYQWALSKNRTVATSLPTPRALSPACTRLTSVGSTDTFSWTEETLENLSYLASYPSAEESVGEEGV